MRLFAPTIRSLHVLAILIVSGITSLPYNYRFYMRQPGHPMARSRAGLCLTLLAAPITWHLFPRQTPGTPSTRHQRDLIRRRVRLLLTALGDTPQAIRTNLHRLHTFGEVPPIPDRYTPLEHYLYLRTGHTFDLGLRLITVNDTFDVATPKSIQSYLRSPYNTPMF